MIKGHSQVTKNDILHTISEEELFKIYCTNFEYINVSFSSELRKDKNPSCRIADLGYGLRYKDFGLANPAIDIWEYIMQKFSLSYPEMLEKIASDLNISLVADSPSTNVKSVPKPRVKPRKHILVRERDWLLCDKEFWFNRYGIPKQLLIDYCIRPISYYWISGVVYTVLKHAYCYDYYWNDGVFQRKIYQPYSKKKKWISNVDTTIVQGIDNIPKKAPLMIISSSLKDLMCFKLLGYPAVAPNNERSWLPKIVWEKFVQRYDKIVIFFDNDDTGVEAASSFSKQFKVPYKYIPLSFTRQNKNISDFIDNYSIKEAKLLTSNLFDSL